DCHRRGFAIPAGRRDTATRFEPGESIPRARARRGLRRSGRLPQILRRAEPAGTALVADESSGHVARPCTPRAARRRYAMGGLQAATACLPGLTDVRGTCSPAPSTASPAL